MSLDGSFTVYRQEDNLSTSTNFPLTLTCSQNQNQLRFKHNERLLFVGLQTTVVDSHKRVLFKTTCIYSILCRYMKQTACMRVSVCLYMWAYTSICIHAVSVSLFICTCDLQDDTCNCKCTEEGGVLCHDPCPHKNYVQRGTVDLGHIQMQTGAQGRIFQPFAWHLMVTFPALLPTTFAQDRGI